MDTIVQQPTITAERFTIRPIRPSDEGLVEMYVSDARVAERTRSIPHPLPPGAARAHIDRALRSDRTRDVWVLDGSVADNSEVLGVIELARIDREQSEISYWVAPALWNAGLASEAVAALLAANPQNCRVIFAEVFQDNPGSARVLTNCGFAYLGDAESFSVARNATVATWTYSRKLY